MNILIHLGILSVNNSNNGNICNQSCPLNSGKWY